MKTTNDITQKTRQQIWPNTLFPLCLYKYSKLSVSDIHHHHYQISIHKRKKERNSVLFIFHFFVINNFQPSDQRAEWLTWQQRNGRSSWPSMKARRACTRSRGVSKTWFLKIPKIPFPSSTLSPLVQFTLPSTAQVICL